MTASSDCSSCSSCSSSETPASACDDAARFAIDPAILARAEELARFRRDIHAHPELGFETHRTVAKVREALLAAGIPETALDTTSLDGALFVRLEGKGDGPVIARRADMDAPPMTDLGSCAWKSTVDGRAHACGHDGHTTWLLGALLRLHELRDTWSGRVIGIFQPSEEIGNGAERVVQTGIFEREGIQEIYGAHDEPSIPVGKFGVKTGPLQAAADFFYLTVKGKGCHGGRPHMGVDPIPVAAQLVANLQTIVARKVNPVENAVVSICSLNAGRFEAPNVVPPEATLSGTVRTFSHDVRAQIESEIRTMTKGICEANGCGYEIRYDRLAPPVINHPVTTDAAREVVAKVCGEEAIVPNYPVTMGGEDFSEYQKVVPGTMIRVGMADDEHTVSLHHPSFDFNDRLTPIVATVFVETALARLKALA